MPKFQTRFLLLSWVFVILSPLQSSIADTDWSVNILITDDQGEPRSVFCEGATVKLTATHTCNTKGTESYSWSPGGSTVNPLTLSVLPAGNYTCTITVTIGNESRTASAGFTVVAVESIKAQPDVVCVGGEVSYMITTKPVGYESVVVYTPADTSMPGAKEVMATCGSSTATCTVTVVGAEISELDRVPPGKTRQVNVTVVPSPLPSGYSISLVCETEGSGTATVSPGTICETTEVTVTGGAPSGFAEKDTIKLKAIFSGEVLDEEPITVCAHPFDFTIDDHVIFLYQYGLTVYFSWKSDSDSVGDLNLCFFQEYVFEARKDSPPFYGSFLAQNRSYTMQGGHGEDEIGTPADCINNYRDGYWIHDQTYKWQCGSCAYLGVAGVGMAGCHVFDGGTTSTDWVIRTTHTTLGIAMIIQDIPDEP